MKAFRYLSVGLCALGMHAADVAAVPVHYVSSGTLDYVQDQNSSLLAYFGEQPAYPQNIGAGTPFTVSLTVDGDLEAFAGFADFDIGGRYQGHMNVTGGGLVCGDLDGNRTCGNFASGLPWLEQMNFFGESSSAPTNLPVSDLSGGNWLFSFSLALAPNTPAPSADTLLTDLPVESMSLWLWSAYSGTRIGPCPEGWDWICGAGGTVTYNISQGWSIDGTATTLTAVPLPSAAWLFCSGVVALTGRKLRKARSRRR
jgi:hypothetical protein